MKEKIKNGLKILFTALGVVAIFDWVIAPGLTAANTFLNILSFILAGVVSTIVGIILWDKITKEGEDIELSEEQQEKILKDIEDKGLYKKDKNKNDGKVY